MVAIAAAGGVGGGGMQGKGVRDEALGPGRGHGRRVRTASAAASEPGGGEGDRAEAARALDAVDDNGMSSLIAARNNGLDDIVKMLWKLGAKPDLSEKKGSTEDEEEEK